MKGIGGRIVCRDSKGEAGRIEHDVRRMGGKGVANDRHRLRVLQAGNIDAQGLQVMAAKFRGQPIDRLGEAAFDKCAVEDDCRDGPVGGRNPIEAGSRKRLRLFGKLASSQYVGCEAERVPSVRNTAVRQVEPQAFHVEGSKRAVPEKRGVGLLGPRQHGKWNPFLAGKRLDRIDAIRPIGTPAKNPDHDDLRRSERALDIEVNRERMLQAEKVGEPQARLGFRPEIKSARQAGELRVGRRQENDVTRRLLQIDGLVVAADGARLGGEQMH